jgi:hypothetical protein
MVTPNLNKGIIVTLRSVFIGEGFYKAPGQFLAIIKNWAAQNKDRRLWALIDQINAYPLCQQAEWLVDWIDRQASIYQRHNCIQFILDTLACDDIS